MDLLLIDGMNLLYRAAWAHPDLTATVEGTTFPSGGMHGFLTLLLGLATFGAPAVICWEGGRRNPRYEWFPAYKQHRSTSDRTMGGLSPRDAVTAQAEELQEVLGLLGFRQVIPSIGEGDDAIAMLAREEERNGGQVGIVSGDADLWGLVSPQVTVFRPGHPEPITPAVVREELGVPPPLVPDWKALAGDPSDNIPGAWRVGKAAAAALLAWFGSLEGVIDAAARGAALPPRCGEKTRAAIVAAASDLLVYRRVSSPIECTIIDLPPPPPVPFGVERFLGQWRLMVLLAQAAELKAFGARRGTF